MTLEQTCSLMQTALIITLLRLLSLPLTTPTPVTSTVYRSDLGPNHDLDMTRYIQDITSDHPYKINAPQICSQSRVLLLVVVCTAVNHTERRDVIRNTWANVTNKSSSDYIHTVKVIFLTGTPLDVKDEQGLKEEHHQHRDIVQGQFIDSYQNLTLKSLLMLRWTVTYCQSARFVLKVDDDTFVDLQSLVANLGSTRHKSFIMGRVISGAQPFHDTNSKYYTSHRMYKLSTYPQYVSGSAYVISGDAVQRLLFNCLRTRPFWIEDVQLTGFCAKMSNVTLIHNAKFNSFTTLTRPVEIVRRVDGGSDVDLRGSGTGCETFKWITIHSLSIKEMYSIWRQYRKKC